MTITEPRELGKFVEVCKIKSVGCLYFKGQGGWFRAPR
ncbi:hypothetical protein KOR42_40260 [Thalassoglobus neptunius]|uniref:Uncharacterized protein n=1 Tax=Thalassoglobus neptunius TaxID=1938619 RepID=A0A5C5WDW6_9PLAN|nr:hypothetical protein KOR42_40260 [Thalassoglobus neptunius]